MNRIHWEEIDKFKFITIGSGLFLGLSGMLYPMFLIKTRLQTQSAEATQYKGTFDAMRQIVRQEGVRGLYKGFWVANTTTIIRQLYFSIFEFSRHRYRSSAAFDFISSEASRDLAIDSLSGTSASLVAQTLSVPVDVVTQRMMVDRGLPNPRSRGKEAPVPAGEGSGRSLSTLEMVRKIYGENGVRGFYRGFLISIIQFAPSSGLIWGLYGLYRPHIQSSVQKAGLDPASTVADRLSSTLSAMLAGSTSMLLTNPIDVIRTRLQTHHNQLRTEAGGETASVQTSILGEARQLYRSEGVKGFFRGLTPRIMLIGPAAAMFMNVYELLKFLSRKT